MFRKNLLGLQVLRNANQFIVYSEQGSISRDVHIQHRWIRCPGSTGSDKAIVWY